jgi:serine/threonine protein kinase
VLPNPSSNGLYSIVYPYYKRGDLLEWLLQNPRGVSISQKWKWVEQLVDTVAFLHEELNVAHMDLSLENIFLDEFFNVVLADFGQAVCPADEPIYASMHSKRNYESPDRSLSNPCYPKCCDIWSLGVCIYSIFFGHFPFQKNSFKLEFFGDIKVHSEYIAMTRFVLFLLFIY